MPSGECAGGAASRGETGWTWRESRDEYVAFAAPELRSVTDTCWVTTSLALLVASWHDRRMRIRGNFRELVGFVLFTGIGIVACSTTSSAPSDAGSSAPPCTPGAQVSCACVGGAKGAQVCNADGHSFSMCQCANVSGDSGTTGHRDAGHDAATEAGGHSGGHVDSGHGSDTGVDAGHPVDAGGTDAPVAHDTGVDAGCTTQPIFASVGMTQMGSNWAYKANVGLAAGNEMCQDQGADHVCDYDDLVLAASKGELSGLSSTDTAWLIRTHSVTVSATSPTISVLGQPATVGTTYPIGKGSNCDDFNYSTDHLNDGEYVNFSTGGNTPTFHFDDNPCVIQTLPKDIPCGHNTMPRDLLCCFAKCGPAPTVDLCTCNTASPPVCQ
jgi:hypothetical protein